MRTAMFLVAVLAAGAVWLGCRGTTSNAGHSEATPAVASVPAVPGAPTGPMEGNGMALKPPIKRIEIQYCNS